MSEILISDKLAEKLIERAQELKIINPSQRKIAIKIVAEAKEKGESPTFENKFGEPDVGITVYVENIRLLQNGSSVFEVYFSIRRAEGITFGTHQIVREKLKLGRDYPAEITLPIVPIAKYSNEITCQLKTDGTLSRIAPADPNAIFLLPTETQEIDKQLTMLLNIK